MMENTAIQRINQFWQCGRFVVDVQTPKVMGIVNLTPDSFSDGGRYSQSVAAALAHAENLLHEGADILDVGGESSRPGADYVSPQQEWQRVAPVLEALHDWGVPITLDTRRTWVMQRALEQGWVDGINDIQALQDDGALALLSTAGNVGVCLMHMQGLPENMQNQPHYEDVVAEVGTFLCARVQACLAAGIAQTRITVDPGFGFGKTLEHNVLLMRHFDEWLVRAGCPALIGVSRKRMIGELTQTIEPNQRIVGSAMAAVAAMARGAAIVRVHDVAATKQAWAVWQALGTI